jgi:hypothetical protein
MRTASNGALKFQKSTDSIDNTHKTSIDNLHTAAHKQQVSIGRPRTNESKLNDSNGRTPITDKQKIQSFHAITGQDPVVYGTGTNFRPNQKKP